MRDLRVAIWQEEWQGGMAIIWELRESDRALACGTTPRLGQALDMVEIAWEQHSEGEG